MDGLDIESRWGINKTAQRILARIFLESGSTKTNLMAGLILELTNFVV
jgi:hypothetical protein